MKKHISIGLLSGMLVIASISGCSSASNKPISTVQVEVKPLQAPTTPNSEAETVAAGVNDFTFRLSAALAQNTGDESFVVSPYSVWLPLAALLNATNDTNREALLTALGASGISAEDINRAASRMMFDLTGEEVREDANPLKIANAIFVNNDVTLRKDFAQTFMDYYRGTVISLDFSSQEAVYAVNEWTYEQTEGLITDIIQSFDPMTVAAITNAIYFYDNWELEFNPSETTERTFNSPTGTQNAHFMLREGIQLYFEDDIVQATHLGFETGGGMYVLLPKSGTAMELVSNMTSEYFKHIQSNTKLEMGRLLLPRFSIKSRFDGLAYTLTALGVPLFNKDTAPLTGGLIYDDVPLWLSSAVQKAVIEVNEQGTTAAAATAMNVDQMGFPPPSFEMICNRPFMFILYQRTFDGGNQVLFTGIVSQPQM